jgi:hypothetical protein
MSAACRGFALLLALAFAAPAGAQPAEPSPGEPPARESSPVEPPPEAPEGEDYAIETVDTLATGAVELGVGASGRPGSAPSRRRRMSFHGDDVSGAVRDGSGDPLAGGTIDGRGRLGLISVGRMAPRWGRGLLLGAASDPWQRDALDRGSGARYRGRAGEGLMLRHRGRAGTEALYGRFGRRTIAGVRVRHGPLALGTLGDGRAAQSSLALARGRGECELAFDRRGGWRAEAVVERPLGEDGRDREGETAGVAVPPGAGGWTMSLRARAGTTGFTSLAEPARRGPSRALALGLDGPFAGVRMTALGALWHFRPGVSGGRAGFAVERPLAHHGAVALGIEEQRGTRRDAGSLTLATLAARAGALRQGWWGEWRGGMGKVSLGLRHESWGERPWARAVVRAVTTARLEARGPAGLDLGLTHSVYRVQRGESLYLPEVESDRLVLRALSGEGERTRVEARTPFAGGRVRAALHLAGSPARDRRPQWTLDWTRRARVRGRGR